MRSDVFAVDEPDLLDEDTIDAFAADTGVVVHQVKAVSPFPNMYSDVCDRAEDVRASIVLLHFHNHRRIDGKMEMGKEGIRMTNQKLGLGAGVLGIFGNAWGYLVLGVVLDSSGGSSHKPEYGILVGLADGILSLLLRRLWPIKNFGEVKATGMQQSSMKMS
ncbi:hypothetical protein U1Q18_021196 [Sarracenia purpurea var. burkii]